MQWFMRVDGTLLENKAKGLRGLISDFSIFNILFYCIHRSAVVIGRLDARFCARAEWLWEWL